MLPLVVVGSGRNISPRTQELLKNTPQVIVTGYLPPSDLQEMLHQARGVLFPTLAEGFGYPPVEALAAGRPVVASQLPVLEEVLGDGARFEHPHDVGGWGEAMRWLASGGQEVNDQVRRGRQQVQRYTLKQLGADTFSVYEEALRSW